MGGWAEGLSCADPGARTPIGVSGNFHKHDKIQNLCWFRGGFSLPFPHRGTLCSAPHRRHPNILASHVCIVTSKHLTLRMSIQCFTILRQLQLQLLQSHLKTFSQQSWRISGFSEKIPQNATHKKIDQNCFLEHFEYIIVLLKTKFSNGNLTEFKLVHICAFTTVWPGNNMWWEMDKIFVLLLLSHIASAICTCSKSSNIRITVPYTKRLTNQ